MKKKWIFVIPAVVAVCVLIGLALSVAQPQQQAIACGGPSDTPAPTHEPRATHTPRPTHEWPTRPPEPTRPPCSTKTPVPPTPVPPTPVPPTPVPPTQVPPTATNPPVPTNTQPPQPTNTQPPEPTNTQPPYNPPHHNPSPTATIDPNSLRPCQEKDVEIVTILQSDLKTWHVVRIWRDANNKVVRELDLTNQPWLLGSSTHPWVSPDGCWVVFQHTMPDAPGANSDLWKVPSGGGGTPVQLTNTTDVDERGPVWGSNNLIYFDDQTNVVSIDSNGGHRTTVHAGRVPVPSPDLSAGAYIMMPDQTLWLDMGGVSKSTGIKAWPVAWLPDGSGLIVRQNEQLLVLSFPYGLLESIWWGGYAPDPTKVGSSYGLATWDSQLWLASPTTKLLDPTNGPEMDWWNWRPTTFNSQLIQQYFQSLK